jgi:hypothetical protein
MLRRTGIVLSLAFAIGAAGSLSGCGAVDGPPGGDSTARQSEVSACALAPAPEEAGTLVVLVWDGGFSAQTGEVSLAAFDLAALPFADGSVASAELATTFRDAVLSRVQTILCDLEPADIAVVADDSDAYAGATIVHITGNAPFAGSKHIGQSDFDPCNEHADDAAVIWGGALARRMPPLSFAQWVNVVANTTAHEIGHTLGFTHPSEDTVARMLPDPTAEIMRANVKPAELAGPQSFLVPQETCPGHAPGDGSYSSLSNP